MQPYLFPYLGYFSLVAAVDRFVFHDDIQYIKNGWVNRNRVLVNGEPSYFTVPLRRSGASTPINGMAIDDSQKWEHRILESLRNPYRRAPHFKAVHAMVQRVLDSAHANIGELAKASVCAAADYIGLRPEFVMTTAAYGNADLHGQDRVIDVCKREAATDYFNLPGGRALYDAAPFAAAAVRLHFVDPVLEPYPQSAPGFQPGLSIIDVLMHNSPERTREMALAGARAAP